jgi:undecaprenyl-diphosphatase
MTKFQAIGIGLAQILALIPGVSRSGITMTAARFFGFSRTEAARYSLLLSIVAISGAGLLGSLDVLETGSAALGFNILLAVLLAFISGYIAIALMMAWLSKATFTPFAIYRVILGLVLLFGLYVYPL